MSAARPQSIRRRLVTLVGGATVVAWVVAVTLSWVEARRELNQLFDAQLAESAKVLLAGSRRALHEAAEHDDSGAFDRLLEHPYEQRLHAQIWTREGRLAYQSSADLPAQPIVQGIENGYADRTLHGTRWRVLVLTDPESGLQIQLCQRYDAREDLAGSIARSMLFPLVVALPLLAFLIWTATGRGIRPLARLASELKARAPETLEPIREEGLPEELQPVVGALDDLLLRLRARFDLERQFTADAAHELRTPLAALKTQAQVALAAHDGAGRDHALGQISRGIDRITHLVQQLLTLARVDPGAAEEPIERVPLAGVVRDVVGEIEGGERVRIMADEQAVVRGTPPLLSILVRNLVENALRHGGAGEVRVTVAAADGQIVLCVRDSGSGIPEHERQRIFDRFYRVAGDQQGGSGLGLSIVKRIAEVHHARIELGEVDGAGLSVTVLLPAVP